VNTKVYYSHGKLLLTGEYVVLDGAKALAVPTNKGQYLTVKPIKESKLIWKSYDENNAIWYEEVFSLKLNDNKQYDNPISKTLLNILQVAQQLSPVFLNGNKGVYVTTKLTFPRAFGLGTSSTLISNIAKWAKVDPYKLLWNSFKGSGYDLACATSIAPVLYQLQNELPKIEMIDFNPVFKEQIYFVYLNKKQDSKEGISHYKTLTTTQSKENAVLRINEITESILSCGNLEEFNALLITHEKIISELLKVPTVHKQLFSEYNKGVVKSLGAWGGDFVMVTVQDKNDLDYFKAKGYTTLFSYNEMLLD